MSNDIYDLITEAIRNRSQVWATYNGHERKMCPHALGSKNGRIQCFFYQFDGTSSKGLDRDGSRKNWRCIPIDGLENATVVDGPWHTAWNYSVDEQTCIDVVIIRVEAVHQSPDHDDDED
jgi:hypothetical protein